MPRGPNGWDPLVKTLRKSCMGYTWKKPPLIIFEKMKIF
jgi:hypothetical protein